MKIFIFIYLLSFSCTTWGRTVIGKVSKMKGMVTRHYVDKPVIKHLWSDDVFMQRRQMKKDFVVEGLYEGAPIYEGDELRTEKSSYVQVKLLDDTRISITSLSVFVFSEFQQINPQKRKALFHHVWGQVRAKFIKKAEPGDLKFKTPHASFGIRGTEFISDVDISEHQREQMNLALLEGDLQVEGEGYVKDMKAGQLIRTDSQGLVDVIEVPAESVDEMLKNPASQKQVLVQYAKVEESTHKSLKIKPPVEIDSEPTHMLPRKKKNWQEILQEQQHSL